MAQQLRAPAALPEDLGSIPTHPYGGSQLCVTPVPGVPTLMKKTPKHIKFNNKIKKASKALSRLSLVEEFAELMFRAKIWRAAFPLLAPTLAPSQGMALGRQLV